MSFATQVIRSLSLFAVIFVLATEVAHAQALGDGVLSGTVVGADGRPAAHVRLEFRSLRDAVELTELHVAETDAHGSFGLLTLAAGDYSVEIAASGKKAAVRLRNVTVREAETNLVMLPASLGVGAVATTQSTDAALTGTQQQVDAAALLELPLEAREWESVARVLSTANDATAVGEYPGTERDGAADVDEAARRGGGLSGSTEAASGVSFAGLPVTQNAERVDGFSDEQSFRSGPRGAAAGGPLSGSSSYGQSALRSVRVLPRSFSAQYGNGAGTGTAIRTRAGTERIHGSAFYLLRESAFAATNPYSIVTHYNNGGVTSALQKPEDGLQQFGGNLGLPLARARHGAPSRFLFASLEEQVRSNPLISTPSDPNFYALSNTQSTVLRVRGVTAVAQNAALNYLDSLSGQIDRHGTRTLAFARADAHLTRHDEVTAAYGLNLFHALAGTGFDQNSEAVTSRGRGSVGDRDIDLTAVTASWRHVLTGHANNEVRFQLARDLESETPHAPLPQEPAVSPGGFAPQISIEPNGFSFGTPAGLGRRAFPYEQRVEAGELLHYARGRHLLSLGGEWSRVHDRIEQLSNAEGSFLYDSATSGAGGLVDWITDYTFSVNAYPNGACPSIVATPHFFCFRSFTQSFGGEDTAFVTHHFAGFAEDHFRLRAGLSLTLGARYEYLLLPLPHAQNVALDAAFANVGGGLPGSTSSFPEDRNNVGPRAAIIWRPSHGAFGTLHVGYGAFYGRLTGATIRAALTDTALPSSTTQIRITPTTEVGCPSMAGVAFGYACVFQRAPTGLVAQTSSATLFASNFRLPAVQRGSLLWEQQLGKHGLVRAEYAVSVATQLPGSTDLNIAPATGSRTFFVQGGDRYPGLRSGQTFVVPLYTARRSPQYGPVTEIVSRANSTYHAGTLEAELRDWNGLQVRGSFTYSRAIDYGPQQGATPRQNGQFDPFTNGYDKGLSSLSFPVRFTGALVYSSQVRNRSRWMREGLGGWQVSSIAFAGSGAPYSYGIFGGTRLNGGRESINGSGGATYLPTVGRNTLRLPPRASLDVRLGREWGLGGGRKVSAFAEAFNVLNQRSLSRVETRAFVLGTPASANAPTPLIFQDAMAIAAEGLTTQPFGTPTSSTAGLSRERRAELGLRLTF